MSDWLYGVEVAPLSTASIRELALNIRGAFNLGEVDPFPVTEFLEIAAPQIIDNFDLEIVEELSGNREACSYPDGNESNPDGPVIVLTESVYLALLRGNGRARFTALHEIGHVLLHQGIPPVLNRGPNGSELAPFRNSEWQANQFAAEALMPKLSFAASDSIQQYCNRMGVSREACLVHGNHLVKKGEVGDIFWLV